MPSPALVRRHASFNPVQAELIAIRALLKFSIRALLKFSQMMQQALSGMTALHASRCLRLRTPHTWSQAAEVQGQPKTPTKQRPAPQTPAKRPRSADTAAATRAWGRRPADQPLPQVPCSAGDAAPGCRCRAGPSARGQHVHGAMAGANCCSPALLGASSYAASGASGHRRPSKPRCTTTHAASS